MRVRVVAGIASVIGSALLYGCSSESTVPAPGGALTNEPFFIRGTITKTGQPWGTLVTGEGSPRYPVSAAYFSIDSTTLIQRADGTAASAADLTVGTQVTVWITGAIAESLPPQVGARLIVIR